MDTPDNRSGLLKGAVVKLRNRKRASARSQPAQRVAAQMQQHLLELASLNRISQSMAQMLPVEQVVQAVLEKVMACVSPDMVLLFVRHDQDLALKGVHCLAGCKGHPETPVHHVGECLCGLAVKTRRPLYSVDIFRDRRCTWTECKQSGMRSFAALPLICDDRILGVLGLAAAKKRDFGKRREFLETLANAVAVALRNTELYEALRHQTSELARSEAQLRALSGHLINAQEEERSRLARELHDHINQRLALLAVELEMAGQGAKGEMEAVSHRMQKLSGMARELSSDVHRISYELHPSTLEQLGLVAAMSSFCREMRETQGIDVEFAPSEVGTIPGDIALCVYRVFQECLWNVFRHSGARTARVELTARQDSLTLIVSDPGAGFDFEAAARKGGLGIVSMRERLRLVGGRLSISTAPGRGTRVEAWVPLADVKSGRKKRSK